ncbi:MAG: riboflavin synthase, partial [Dermatophilaceae bacterium]
SGAERFTADVMAETLERSTLGGLRPGDRVNLERAMAASSRFGGHVVQGHVDGTSRLVAREPGERWEVVRFTLPGTLAPYLVEKGSVTVDGVSLTVVDVAGRAGSEEFSVSLIPTTLTLTTLGSTPVGGAVNLEVDVLAKYVERLLATRFAPKEAIR